MNKPADTICLGRTESVCPQCLRTLPARRYGEGDTVFLEKTCPEHGRFVTPVWRGLESYRLWAKSRRAIARPIVAATAVSRGCPHDCGLCPDHLQQSCCVLLEITSRCDLLCPYCFASAGRHGTDASMAEIDDWLATLNTAGGRMHIQLSGGEPTMRDDLADVIALVRSRGFDFVQLNTNGLRIAREPAYLAALVQAGLDCVFLQFDGVSDAVHRRMRGRDLMAVKKTAIRNCGEAGVGVVLVPTLVPGINVHEIGAIVDFAKVEMPTVRAVHFQPVSYFGRTPAEPGAGERITLPEVMQALIDHCGGTIRLEDFRPGSAENPFCSFSGRFDVDAGGRLSVADEPPPSCCCSPAPVEEKTTSSACCSSPTPSADVARARRYVAGQWSKAPAAAGDAAGLEAFDAFIDSRSRRLGLSGMAFQDAWTLDLERLRQCYIHVVRSDGRVIPFCAYNLTDRSGRALYRPLPA